MLLPNKKAVDIFMVYNNLKDKIITTISIISKLITRCKKIDTNIKYITSLVINIKVVRYIL